jgi:hypothetical protein
MREPEIGVPSMPTTRDILTKSADDIAALLPREFYGGVRLIYEAGRFVRAVIDQSVKV